MRDDRPGRSDGQLLACDLEDERAEGIERRELVQPGARTEVRPRVDEPREHRVRLTQEFARLGIGNRGSLEGWSLHAHVLAAWVFTMPPPKLASFHKLVVAPRPPPRHQPIH